MSDDIQQQLATWPNLANLGTGQGSKNEHIKYASHFLRGRIFEELRQEDQWHFTEEQVQLLKFHGTYQQDDRDIRRLQRSSGEKAYQLMVRTRIPGGALHADQYLALDALAEKYGNETMRLTTRQTIQLHGILKGDLHAAMHEINEALLSTLAACGDVNRNVMTCPAPAGEIQKQIQDLAQQLAIQLAPQSGAYHEIWVDGQQHQPQEAPVAEEPLYGSTYLPRKFKIGIAHPCDNCIDVYTQDLGFAAIAENNQLIGFTVLVGGGMGRTHGKRETFPRVGSALCFIPVDEALPVAKAILTIYRDYGDRQNRRHARLKYLVETAGVEWLRKEIEQRTGLTLAPPRSLDWEGPQDHLGVHRQSSGTWYVGIHIKNGRVADTAELPLRTALRQVIARFRPEIRLTPQQNILLTDIPGSQKRSLLVMLEKFGLQVDPGEIGTYRFAMACPALPTCGLAVAESERALPAVIQAIEADLLKLGLRDEPMSIRMTGCANGCARPYMGDIGFVGRSLGLYAIYLGGDARNTRLNALYQESVALAELAATLHPLFVLWKFERKTGEHFGDYCHRIGIDALKEKAQLFLYFADRLQKENQHQNYFPAMLNLRHRRAVVIGGDAIAYDRVCALLASGALVTVVALSFCASLTELGEFQQITLRQKVFSNEDLDGAFVVIVASQEPDVNEYIWQVTQERGLLVNIVDVPERCSFIMPSILRRGPMSISVSTNGTNPSMAGFIRQQLEQTFSAEYDDFMQLAAITREELRERGVSYLQRSKFFKQYISSDVLRHLEAHDADMAISTVVAMMLENVSADIVSIH